MCVSAITLCICSPSFAQEEAKNTTEFGFTTGPMAYLGDLGGHVGKGTTFIKDYNMNKTKASYGAYYAVYPCAVAWLSVLLANYGNVGDLRL